MVKIFHGHFDSVEDVENSFCVTLTGDERIIFAEYDRPDYEGYARVWFEVGGEIFEVYGSHCSCYGLEDQWKPERVTIASLRMRSLSHEQEECLDEFERSIN